jgi:hypothetical protein
MSDLGEFSYHPTPLEEAYGIHLLRTVFQIPSISSASGVVEDPPFRVPGREAVPFLRLSGLSRNVLRNIWSAVDPDSTGRLTSPHQLYVILRLVALSQNILLVNNSHLFGANPQMAAAATPTIDMLRQSLLNHANRVDLPLAVFDGYPVPDESALRTLYFQTHCVSAAPSSTAATSSGDSLPPQIVSPAFSSSLGGGSVTSYNPNPVSNPTSFDASAFGTQQNTLSSIDDAFGSLIDIQDAPPPSLMMAVEMSSTPPMANTESQSFGGGGAHDVAPEMQSSIFEEQVTHPIIQSSFSSSMYTAFGNPEHSYIPDPFGSTQNPLLDTASALSSALDVQRDQQTQEQQQLDDSFTAFAGAENVQMSDKISRDHSDPNAQAEDDEFGDFSHAPQSGTSKLGQVQDTANTFASSTGSATPAFGSVTVGDWDALDALAGVNDAPLPSLALPTQQPPMEDTDTKVNDGASRDNEDDQDDDFGTFEGVLATTETSADDALAETGLEYESGVEKAIVVKPVVAHVSNDDDFGDFEGTTTAPATLGGAAIEMDAWSTFDGLQQSEDVTTPGLQSSLLDAVSSQNIRITDASIQPSHSSDGNKPEPTREYSTFPADSIDNEDANFGGFVGTDNYNAGGTVSELIVAETATEREQDMGWGALDSLSNVQDLPLQPLDAFGSLQQLKDPQSPELDDDFGDFVESNNEQVESNANVVSTSVGARDMTSNVPAETQSPTPAGWDAFDVLAPPCDAPPPPLLGATFGQPVEAIASGNSDGQSLKVYVDNFASKNVEEVDSGIIDGYGDDVALDSGAEPTNMPSCGSSAEIEEISGNLLVRGESSSSYDSFVGGHAEEEQSPDARGIVSDQTFLRISQAASQPLFSLDHPVDMDRVDSSYYSAQPAKSMSEDSDDFGGFDDAVENLDSDGKTRTELEAEGGVGVNALVETSNEDPFSAFDSVAAPPPTLPGYLQGVDVFESGTTFSSNIDNQDCGTDYNGSEKEIADDVFGEFARLDIQQSDNVYGGDTKTHFAGFSDIVTGEGLTDASVPDTNVDITRSLSQPDEVGDDFGDFASSAFAEDEADKVKSDESRQEPAIPDSVGGDDDDDDFGDFEHVSSELQHVTVEDSGAPDESFGEFAAFEAEPDFVTTVKDSQENIDGVWDAFQEASHNDDAVNELFKKREEINRKSSEIPESLRQKSSEGGGQPVSYASVFDVNIGVESPLSEERKTRIDRSLLLMELLSSSHVKLATTHWNTCLSITRDELETCNSLLQDAKLLPRIDIDVASGPLIVYLDGLGEFVRVARNIAATLGDLLMLESSSLLTVDTWESSWCSLAFAETVLQIEQQWKVTQDLASTLGLAFKNARMDSIPEIRSKATSSLSSPLSDLCHCTLRPFNDSFQNNAPVTTSRVYWKDLPFHACAANMVSNRYPEYSFDLSQE